MTETAQMTRLMQNVRTHVPGALDDVIRMEMFNVLTEFFADTKAWQEDIDFDTVVDQTEYYLSSGDPAVIITLMGVANADDSPVKATMTTPEIVVLNTAPSAVETLTATVALNVVDPEDTDGYPRLPDGLLKQYHATILAGILSRMMAQPAKPYTNERMAVFHLREFRSNVASVRASVRRANLYGGQRWRFPAWAAGSQR